MSKENVEIVRRLYETINQVGVAAIYALPDATRREMHAQFFDPELEVRQSSEIVFDTAGTFHGYEGFIEAARELVEGIGDLRFDVGEAFDAGNQVVFKVRGVATGNASGVPVESRLIAHLWELKDGLIRRWIVYPTVAEALAAAGLQK